MATMKTKLLLLFLCLATMGTACKKRKFKKASKSLQGNWTIEQAYIGYGERMELGIQQDSSFTETDIGWFTFDENEKGSYEFSLKNELYEATDFTWELSETNVGGFTNAKAFLLHIDGQEYRLTFGDGTSDAYKDAEEISLFFETDTIGQYFSYQLEMSKNQ